MPQFKVAWKVLDLSDAEPNGKPIAHGETIKVADSAEAMQAVIDTELLPVLRKTFRDTAHSTREHYASFVEVPTAEEKPGANAAAGCTSCGD